MFTWIVTRINEAIDPKLSGGDFVGKNTVIGVLDIYGFEIFDNNRYVHSSFLLCYCVVSDHHNVTIKYVPLVYPQLMKVRRGYTGVSRRSVIQSVGLLVKCFVWNSSHSFQAI